MLNVTGTTSKSWLEKPQLPANAPCLIYHPRVWFSQISEKSTIPENQEVCDLPPAFKMKTLISKSGKNEMEEVMTCVHMHVQYSTFFRFFFFVTDWRIHYTHQTFCNA